MYNMHITIYIAICISYNTGKSSMPDIIRMTTEGTQCPKESVYISGKAWVIVLQLKCYTFGTLKICPNMKLNVQLAYI